MVTGVQTAQLTRVSGGFKATSEGGIELPRGTFEVTFSAVSGSNTGGRSGGAVGIYAALVSTTPTLGSGLRQVAASQGLSTDATFTGGDTFLIRMAGSPIITHEASGQIFLAFPNTWADPKFPQGTGAPITVTVKGDYNTLTRLTSGCPDPCDRPETSCEPCGQR